MPEERRPGEISEEANALVGAILTAGDQLVAAIAALTASNDRMAAAFDRLTAQRAASAAKPKSSSSKSSKPKAPRKDAKKVTGTVDDISLRGDWTNVKVGGLRLSTKLAHLAEQLDTLAESGVEVEVFYTEKENGSYVNRYVEAINPLSAPSPSNQPAAASAKPEEECPW